MNYLVHAWLCRDMPAVVQMGNFSGDLVKGPISKIVSKDFALGVSIHRKVDSFTDSHPLLTELQSRFPEEVRKYSGIAMDLYWDYCMSCHWQDFNEMDLISFEQEFHALIIPYLDHLNDPSKKRMQAIIDNHLLLNYQKFSGIEASLKRIQWRSSQPLPTEALVQLILEFQPELEKIFIPLLNDLEVFVNEISAL